ncbi:MAG: integrase arm-type DNA-binding domain-containing protein [Pseudohongiellaceae bacterium]
MPKAAKILSARAVSELRWRKTSVDKKGKPIPTWHPVGGAVGLYLQCTKDGGRSWFYRYSSIEGDGRRIPMGLGTYTYKSDKHSEALTLKQVRELAQHYAGLRAKGLDPITERDKDKKAAIAQKAEGITFMQVAEDWMTVQVESKEWNSPTTISRARQWMTDYVYPIIGHLPILDVKYEHARKILSQKTVEGKKHLWNDQNPTGKKLRGYCENIIDKGLVTLQKRGIHFNVFIYKNNLNTDFGKPTNIHDTESRPFLHYENLPEFIERLIAIQKLAPKGGRPDIDCFIFGMLACTRSNCTRIADWEDIDLEKKLWIVPREKVGKKTKRDWPIPLHPRAIRIIKAQPSARRMKGRIFSTLNHKKFHDKNLADLLKLFPDIKAHKERADDPDRFAVFHGVRTTMNGWAKKNKYDFDTRELMMQHLAESRTHAAYDRGNAMLEERREIVNGYEQYAFSMVTGKDKVVPIRREAS